MTASSAPPVPSPSPNAHLSCAVRPDKTAPRPEPLVEEPLIPPGSSTSRASVGFEQERTKGGCLEPPWSPERGLACLVGWNAALLSHYPQAWTIDANEQPNPVLAQTSLRTDRLRAPSSHGFSLPASYPQVSAQAAVNISSPRSPTNVLTQIPLRPQHAGFPTPRFSIWSRLPPRTERQSFSPQLKISLR